MSLLFGRLTNDFVHFGQVLDSASKGNADAQAQLPAAAADFRHSASLNASYLVYIGTWPCTSAARYRDADVRTGVGMLAVTFAYMYIWVYTAEVNAKRLREQYLQAVLRQDIAYFDNVGAGEVATRIQTDTRTLDLKPASDDRKLIKSCRSRPARYIGEGCSSRQLPWSLCLRFHPRLCQVMATCSRAFVYPSLHCDYRCRHEQVHLHLHAVRNLVVFPFRVHSSFL